MKKSYLLIVLLMAFVAQMGDVFAQKTEDVILKGKGKVSKIVRRVKPFSEISVAGPIDVVLREGKMEDASVEIDDNLQQYVSMKSDGKTLKIEVQKGYNIKEYQRFVVDITCIRVDNISAAGIKNLKVENTLHTDNLKLSFAGVEKANIMVDAKKIDLSAAGCGPIKLSGKANTATISNAGGEEVDVLELKVRNITANLAGGANASIYTEDKMEVNIGDKLKDEKAKDKKKTK